MEKMFKVNGMMCSGCQARVKRIVSLLNGVQNVSVDLENGKMCVQFDPEQVQIKKIIESLNDAGFQTTEL